jgi:sterol desaturase/sphingolipid hydroxylase (fatty acid hydroxylase superfamily)
MIVDRLMEAGAALARDAWGLFVEQLRPPFLSLASQLYWTHIAAALALAALVTLVHARGGAAARRSLSFSLPGLRSIGRVLWHRSARVDYAYYFVNGVVYPLLVLPWLVSDESIRSAVEARLAELVGPGAPGERPGALVVIALSAAIFVAYDFGRWVGHFIQHRVPALWEFHKVHHTALVLTPVTNFRVHPVDLAVMATCTTLSVGAAAGVILCLFPGDAALFGELSLRAALALFAFDLAGSLLRHTSVWLSYGPALGRVFISPAQHQIHHSTDARHAGKNMGFALAVWDWLAGTLYVTGEREPLTYGAGDGDDGAYSSVLRLYAMPLRGLWARLFDHARVRMTTR